LSQCAGRHAGDIISKNPATVVAYLMQQERRPAAPALSPQSQGDLYERDCERLILTGGKPA
jgi:hypothetical protein